MDGVTAEQKAAEHLRRQGLKLIARNYNMPGGEIDIIAREGKTLVFVEVRFRRSARFGSAQESINLQKQQRIIRAASHYLQENRLWDKIACRFDTICISFNSASPSGLDISWQKNAFTL